MNVIRTSPPPFFILTGPPGSGKTSLIEALSMSYSTIPEFARRVLAEERQCGGTATGDQNPSAFVDRMLDMAKSDYDQARGRTVFDRGLPDLLAFCSYYGLPDKRVQDAIARRRYRGHVFFLPPWEEIYRNDNERTLTFRAATAFGALTRTAYERAGYRFTHVPKVSVADRAAFVQSKIEA